MTIAPIHDELVLAANGTAISYKRGIPTRPARPHVVAGTEPSPRPRMGVLPRSPGALGAPLPSPSAVPTATAPAPAPLTAAQRENIRSLAARSGYLPPQSLDEATYPSHWFPELARRS